MHKLPFILGISAAIVVGAVSHQQGISAKEIYVRMAVGTIGFYVLGLYVKNTLERIYEQLEEKRKKEEEEELAKAEAEEKERAAQEKAAGAQEPASTVDYRIDGYGEDFSPLTVSDIIHTKS